MESGALQLHDSVFAGCGTAMEVKFTKDDFVVGGDEERSMVFANNIAAATASKSYSIKEFTLYNTVPHNIYSTIR